MKPQSAWKGRKGGSECGRPGKWWNEEASHQPGQWGNAEQAWKAREQGNQTLNHYLEIGVDSQLFFFFMSAFKPPCATFFSPPFSDHLAPHFLLIRLTGVAVAMVTAPPVQTSTRANAALFPLSSNLLAPHLCVRQLKDAGHLEASPTLCGRREARRSAPRQKRSASLEIFALACFHAMHTCVECNAFSQKDNRTSFN